MDNEIQGSMVGLWFSKNYVAPLCLMIIWEMRRVLQAMVEGKYPVLQASNEKEKMGMERTHLGTVTVQGWPQKHRTGLSTGQRPQFKTVLTHLLIIPISTFPEAKQTCLGCPGDTPAWSLLSWELPRATVPHHRVQPGGFTPEQHAPITLGSSQEQHQLLCWTKPGSLSPAGIVQGRWRQTPHKLMGGHKGAVGTSVRSTSKRLLKSVHVTRELPTGLSVKKLCEGQNLLSSCKNKAPKKQWSH